MAAPREAQPLTLRTGDVDTAFAQATLPELVQESKAAWKARSVIQLDGPMTPERRSALEDAGVVLGEYLPPNAFVADLSGTDEAKVAGLGFIRWQGRYDIAWKLDNEIGLRRYVTEERVEQTRKGDVSVVVHLFEGENVNDVAGAIAGLPGVVVHAAESADGIASITASMPFNTTVLLTEFPEVQFVEDAPENTERSNSNDRWIVQSNLLNVTPVYDNGITGVGQIIGVIDSNLDMNHCSFRDAVNNTPGASHRKVLAYNATLGAVSHGTHVSGTVAGDNGLNDDTRGVAYGAKIVYNTIPAQTEAGITQRLTLHYGQGARIHTNSWGDDGTTAYTGQCRGIDAHTYANEDSLVLFAVTNTSTLKTPENAKNCLAVGASQGSGGQQNFCSGGTGPTNDGRRKPEIFAPGCSTVSSASNTACGTTALTGTSMACPAVAGAAILARQYYTDGYYPSGAANPGDGFIPSAALIKATLLNSAVDMTGIAGYPSNQEGWGRVLLDNTLAFPSDTSKLFALDVRNANGLSTGSIFEQGINVTSASGPFEVTLVWTDPPAAANANPAYINNLDLEVVGPGGEVYLGNNFVSGQSATGGAADFRNNVEVVLLNVPTPGAYILRVRATAVNQGTQGYALVASGDITTGPRPLSISALGVPSLVAPGDPTVFNVVINPGDDALVAGSPTLHYRPNALASFISTPLVSTGGTNYEATLPAFLCEDDPQFFVSAAGDTTGTVNAPFNGSSNPFAFAIGEVVTSYSDTIEVDSGWTVGAVGDTATTGIWTRVDPIGTTNQPEDDTTPTGTQCFVTGQHTAGQTAGFNDIDGGATTLLSPVIDLAGAGNPTISYNRWTSLGTSDSLIVSLSNDGGVNWVTVENLTTSTSAWVNFQFQPASLLPLTSQMRLRFVAGDLGTASIAEAAIDDVFITSFACVNPPPPDCLGDANNDGMIDFADISTVLGAWGGSGPLGDADHNGAVNFKDITAVLASFGMNCP